MPHTHTKKFEGSPEEGQSNTPNRAPPLKPPFFLGMDMERHQREEVREVKPYAKVKEQRGEKKIFPLTYVYVCLCVCVVYCAALPSMRRKAAQRWCSWLRWSLLLAVRLPERTIFWQTFRQSQTFCPRKRTGKRLLFFFFVSFLSACAWGPVNPRTQHPMHWVARAFCPPKKKRIKTVVCVEHESDKINRHCQSCLIPEIWCPVWGNLR